MCRKLISVVLLVLSMTVVAQASLFYEDFESGLAAQSWVIEGALWGGAGTDEYLEGNAWQRPLPPSSTHWCYFQINGENASGIYVDTGVAVADNATYTLSYTTGSNSTGWATAGMYAQLYAGNPYGGGTWLGHEATTAPASLTTASHSVDITTGSGLSGNLFIRFGLTTTGGNFEQPILDNVQLTIPEPATMTLLGISGLALIRRKRS